MILQRFYLKKKRLSEKAKKNQDKSRENKIKFLVCRNKTKKSCFKPSFLSKHRPKYLKGRKIILCFLI